MMMTNFRSIAALTLITIAGAASADELPSLPQIPEAQVKRAISFSRTNVLSLLRNAFVVPNWIGNDSFWYKRDIEGGVEWVRVQAASGGKTPLFDHAAMATALSTISAQTQDPKHLPVTDIDWAAGVPVLLMNVKGQGFRCQIQPAITCISSVIVKDPQLVESPDHRSTLFVRNNNLWVRQLDSGVERALTTDGEVNNAYALAGYDRERQFFQRTRDGKPASPQGISWSPDSRRILVPRIDLLHVTPYPWIETSPVDGSFRPIVHEERIPLVGERPAQWSWYIVDVQSGAMKMVALPADTAVADGRSLHPVQWSDDGSRLYAITLGHQFESRTLFEIDASTASARAIISDTTLAFDATSVDLPLRIIDHGRQIIWPTVRGDYLHLDLHDLATGRRLRRITAGAFHVRAILGVDEISKKLYFVANGRESGNPYYRYVYSIGLNGSGLRLLTPEPADHQVLDATASNIIELQDETPPYRALSPDNTFLVYAYSTVSQPTRFAIRRTADGALVAEYEHTDASRLLAAGYRPPEEMSARSTDGERELWGLIYRPSDYDPKRHYAVINTQYASPVSAATPRNFNGAATRQFHFESSAATAELGFLVVVVDGRGTPFRSRTFSGPRPGYLATMGLEDHVAFIRHLVERDPSIDLNRIGITGASFGGWTTLRGMLEFPEFYKVGVAGTVPGTFYAMPDFPSLTSTIGAPKYENGRNLRPTATATPENWSSIDSLRQIDRLQGKLLLIIGEQDEHVLPGSTLQFFDRALNANKDVWLIQVPNAQHNVVGYQYSMREALSFLLQHLNGTRLPSGTMIPSPVPYPLDPRVAPKKP